jgi:multiple sugar transport system substrate-binding protein
MTRRQCVAGAAALSATSLAACTQGNTGGAPPPAGEVKGTLDFMTNQAAAPFAAVEAAVATFKQQHPQIDVRVTNVATGSDDKLRTLIAAGTPPDMYRVGGDQFASFYVLKAMLQLDALFKRDKYDLSDFYAPSLEQYKWSGKQFGMPSDYGYRQIYYNADLFQKAGLPLPPGEWNAPGWTFDDFNRAARALTLRDPGNSNPQWGFLNPRASWQIWGLRQRRARHRSQPRRDVDQPTRGGRSLAGLPGPSRQVADWPDHR